MLRKQTAILTAVALLTVPTALAEAPTSQFGYKGWPYRVTTNCAQAATDCPTGDPLATTPGDVCPTDAAENDISCGENTAKPSCSPTSAPCDATDAPSCPTVTPTAAPEAAPTAEATSVPTEEATARPTAQATQTPSMDEDYTTDSVSAQEQKAVNLLNADRLSNGLSALAVDPALSRLARLKSEDMRDLGYFAHTSPTYGSAADMLRAFGYSFSAVGENIAHHATVEKSQAAFMSSDGHRRNILGTSWTKVGVGVCLDRNGFVYVTQLFAR